MDYREGKNLGHSLNHKIQYINLRLWKKKTFRPLEIP
jgi:hypothetical protein